MYNSNNDYININDVLIVNKGSNNTQQLILSGDEIKVDSSNINFNTGGGNFNVNGNAQFSNITVLGTPTFCNLDLSSLLSSQSSNARFYSVYASNAELSNVTITGPINFQNTAWFGSNIVFNSNVTMCNTSNLYITGGGLHIDERTLIKDLVVYGSITLCNGTLTSNIGGSGGGGSGGGIVFPPPTSNGIDYSNFPDGHFTHANVYAEVLTEIDDTLLVHSNLYVCGNIFTLGTITSGAVVSSQGTFSALNVSSNANFAGTLTASNAVVGTLQVNSTTGVNGMNTPYVDFTSNNTKYWRQWMDIKTVDICADLIFESVNGSVVTFNDDFHPEVLNFTGKHRCVYTDTDNVKRSEKDLIGKLMIASGKYCGLNGHRKPELDEAIPVVRLCKKANDSRVFGVFAGFEEKGEFHIGNITFRTGAKYGNIKRAVIQSVGEGCLWVCDVNGKVKNGDFLCSSPIHGYAMKQSEDIYLNKTVAKATTSCAFRKDISKLVRYKGKNYKCAFIGVTYKM
jgi:hypothetical protein